MEMAQFGDTEIESSDIKKTWMALTHEEKNKKCPKLEQEFAKLAKIVDDRKALSVGGYSNGYKRSLKLCETNFKISPNYCSDIDYSCTLSIMTLCIIFFLIYNSNNS